ncbi:hypothetical protein BDW_03155 [Bdellovibrio bacteriovorus W]|nr:hypothetical protein BDW_03155 [Bdellovibrio bacteriovorus W]
MPVQAEDITTVRNQNTTAVNVTAPAIKLVLDAGALPPKPKNAPVALMAISPVKPAELRKR